MTVSDYMDRFRARATHTAGALGMCRRDRRHRGDFLPFFPGGHDPLAGPLSAMAWALGRVGLLLVPVGGMWLWVAGRPELRPAPPAWLVKITLGASILIALVTVLAAFASSGSQMSAAVTAAFLGLLTIRIGPSPAIDTGGTLDGTNGGCRPDRGSHRRAGCTGIARRPGHGAGAEPRDRERRAAHRRDRALSREAWRVSRVALLDLGGLQAVGPGRRALSLRAER